MTGGELNDISHNTFVDVKWICTIICRVAIGSALAEKKHRASPSLVVVIAHPRGDLSRVLGVCASQIMH